MPTIAEESYEHRAVWKESIEQILSGIRALGVDETARTLVARHLGDELDVRDVRSTALLLGDQLQAADDRGILNQDLLADAFGVAAWVIGASPREEPSLAQLSYLSDPRLQIALGYSALTEPAGPPQ
jgi:hypothetical protein